MLVIDASAVVELLLGRSTAEQVAGHIARPDSTLSAPHLVDVEVLNALRRLLASHAASVARVEQAVTDFVDLPIERYPHEILVPRIWDLRSNFSAYDAVYLALTEALAEEEASLLTADVRFARAARDHSGVAVILVE